jgi:hypothetical protein
MFLRDIPPEEITVRNKILRRGCLLLYFEEMGRLEKDMTCCDIRFHLVAEESHGLRHNVPSIGNAEACHLAISLPDTA